MDDVDALTLLGRIDERTQMILRSLPVLEKRVAKLERAAPARTDRKALAVGSAGLLGVVLDLAVRLTSAQPQPPVKLPPALPAHTQTNEPNP